MKPVSEASYWEERYRAGATSWDLGGPCPVLSDLLDSPLAPPPGRVAFPGCGRGHDVVHWRARGYEAVGFDFALEDPDRPIVRLDVFRLGDRYPGGFDAVVEYTCYCAIDPGRRGEYAGSLRRALKPGGLLVALMFPVSERAQPEVPPYFVREHEIDEVVGHGLEPVHRETPDNSVADRLGHERLALFRKPR